MASVWAAIKNYIDPNGRRFSTLLWPIKYFAPLARAVEYTDCTSAEGYEPHLNECSGYDTKQSDGEVPVMLELWGMRSIPSLPLLPCPLWPGVVAPGRVLSMSQIELNCVLMLNWIVWNRTVYLYKMDLALNNLRKLICHKTQPTNEILQSYIFRINLLEYIFWIVKESYYLTSCKAVK